MTDTDHTEMLKKRAYAIWEAEGRPFGRDDSHWSQAVAEFGSEPAGTSPVIATPAPLKEPSAKRAKTVYKP